MTIASLVIARILLTGVTAPNTVMTERVCHPASLCEPAGWLTPTHPRWIMFASLAGLALLPAVWWEVRRVVRPTVEAATPVDRRPASRLGIALLAATFVFGAVVLLYFGEFFIVMSRCDRDGGVPYGSAAAARFCAEGSPWKTFNDSLALGAVGIVLVAGIVATVQRSSRVLVRAAWVSAGLLAVVMLVVPDLA